MKKLITNYELREVVDLGKILAIVYFSTHVIIENTEEFKEFILVDNLAMQEREAAIPPDTTPTEEQMKFLRQFRNVQLPQHFQLIRIDFVDPHSETNLPRCMFSISEKDLRMITEKINNMVDQWRHRALSNQQILSDYCDDLNF